VVTRISFNLKSQFGVFSLCDNGMHIQAKFLFYCHNALRGNWRLRSLKAASLRSSIGYTNCKSAIGIRGISVNSTVCERNLTTTALRYGTRCRWISEFYLHPNAFIHEWNEPPVFAFPAKDGSHLPIPESWVDLGTTTVNNQSSRDRYVTAITVVSCSSRHVSLGNWSTEKRRAHDLSGRKPWRWPLRHRVAHWAYQCSYCLKAQLQNELVRLRRGLKLYLFTNRN